MRFGSNERKFGHYKYRSNGNMQRTFNTTHKSALRNSSLYAKPLNTLENFIFFFASIPSVWIDSTVEATGKHLQFG